MKANKNVSIYFTTFCVTSNALVNVIVAVINIRKIATITIEASFFCKISNFYV